MKLDDWLEDDHSLNERLELVAGLCGAIEDNHRRGVVTGGVEPAEVDVAADGTCRLGSDPPRPSSPYCAPELAAGGKPTARAEVYSAGLICCEALSGFTGLGLNRRKVLQEVRPALPQELIDALLACVEEDPEWRPADLSYVLTLANDQLGAAPASAAGPARRGVSATGRAPLNASRAQRRTGGASRKLWLIPAVVIAAAALAWAWYSMSRPPGATSVAGTTAPRSPTPVPPGSASPSAPMSPAASLPAIAAPPTTPTPRTSGDAGTTPAPTPTPTPRATPTPTASPSAAAGGPPSPVPRATPSPAAPTPAPPSPARPESLDPARTARATPEPTPAAAAVPLGPASIRAIAPFKLRAGGRHALDVHGANLSAGLQARIVRPKKREPAPGFRITRHQLLSPNLMLVYLELDPSTQTGKYAFSLVAPGGEETNPFTIEVGNK